MKRVFYLPESSCSLSGPYLKEAMRRWHWRQYFVYLRRQKNAVSYTDAMNSRAMAMYHRGLADSIQKTVGPHDFPAYGSEFLADE